MTYKAGDRVRVRRDLTTDSTIKSSYGINPGITAEMADKAGSIITISSYMGDGLFYVEEDHWTWPDTVLEPIRQVPVDHIELPNGCYKPFEIPRKNKSPRKVCAPDPELLAYQRSQLKTLEKEFFKLESEYQIENIMHGFIPNRNCVTAASKHVGYGLTIMMDIIAFFDSVQRHHTKHDDPSLYTVDGYCGQGFATSPMLANIGIVPIVKAIDNFLQDLYPDNYAFSIYADDIQISLPTESYEEANEVIEVVTAAFEFYDFQIHPHKTRIRYAKHGWRKILGVNVGTTDIRATRKTMRKLRAAKHQSNGPSAGGLTTWSKCLLPRKLRPKEPVISVDWAKRRDNSYLPGESFIDKQVRRLQEINAASAPIQLTPEMRSENPHTVGYIEELVTTGNPVIGYTTEVRYSAGTQDALSEPVRTATETIGNTEVGSLSNTVWIDDPEPAGNIRFRRGSPL